MTNKYFVAQNGFKDCGPSCLLSIMKYYGCEASHEEVTYNLKTDRDGTNAFNIINGSKLYGFDGYGIHLSCDDIVTKKISFPIICHVLKDNMYHFIVVYKVDKNILFIMDPSSKIDKITINEFNKIYLGTSIFIYPVKYVGNNLSKENIYNCLKPFILEERSRILKLIVLSLIVLFIGIGLNYFSMIIIDYIIPNYNIKYLFIVSVMFLISVLVKNILSLIRGKYLIDIIHNISVKFINGVTRKLFNLPYQFFKSKSSADVLNRINDLKTFKEIISNLMVNISTDIILIVISVIILLFINVKLFIIHFIEMILYSIIILVYRKKYIIESENILVSDSVYNKCLNESIYSYESNLNINITNRVLRELDIKNIDNSFKLKNYSNTMNNQNFLKDLIVNVSYIISMFVSAIFIYKNNITIGEFILFNSIVYYFTEPLKDILDFEPKINHLKNIYNRINDLLIYKSKTYDQTNKCIKGDIQIDSLSYSYNGIDKLFNNINISIKYGSKFLIYGQSGFGKSTIIKTILKYNEEYNGNIFINNINLKDINRNIISNSFTYVSQNSYINNNTLKNNIIYYRDISDEDYEKIIHLCNLDKLRDRNKFRDNFVIEDNGFNISGGERQKIILARSLLKNSNYIILDESLSEVDIDEEKEILNKILNIYHDKTIIYVSHKKEIIDLFNEKYEVRKENVC